MLKSFRFIFPLVFLCTGCTSWFARTPEALSKVTDLITARVSSPEFQTEMQDYYSQDDEGKRAIMRNRIAGDLLLVVDGEYQLFVVKNAGKRAFTNTALDITAIGLGAAATLTPHDATSKLLAGLATVATGSRASIDKNFFFDSTMPAIVAMMDAQREERRQVIHGLLEKSDNEAGLSVIVGEIYEYHLEGTIPRALSRIQAMARKDPNGDGGGGDDRGGDRGPAVIR